MHRREATGKVFLIGAGPGDPGLLTLKGRSILERAEVVVYDYLADEGLLAFCRPEAERVYVGKQSGHHTLSQGEINDLLVRKAKAGALVARLKGGDPYIFGRGSEEAEALEREGIPFEVIPGVSSAIAAPAYAGIPLTDRRHASSVTIVTGHEDATRQKTKIPWEHLAHGAQTLVFLMGVKNLDHIVRQLLHHGRDAQSPAALIRWGTTSRQCTVTAPLGGIVQEARRVGMAPPAVLVVGEVVTLRDRLAWFETAPLFGRRILVTRAREQASELAEQLRALGADPVEFPTIQIGEPADWVALDKALGQLGTYHWILFTSPNGVRFFLRRLMERGGDIRDLKGASIGAIGPGTAGAIEALGVRVDVVPRDEYRAEALADSFSAEQARGKRFLLPRAEEARDVLPRRLEEMGGRVDVVTAYRTQIPKEGPPLLRRLFLEKRMDAVTFTSSSTVKNFVEMAGREALTALLEGVAVACIGPVTMRTAETEGIPVHIMPEAYTIPGLVRALVAHFEGERATS
jgi:uroporphyrinogen III methyltransferase/synthase